MTSNTPFDARGLLHELHTIDSTLSSAPSYLHSVGRERLDHTFVEQLAQGSTLTLVLRSFAGADDWMPLYFDRTTVSGSVTLDLKGKIPVKEVLVKLRGYTQTVYQEPGPAIDPLVFLKLDAPLWPTTSSSSSSLVSPSPSLKSPSSLLSSSSKKSPSLSTGVHTWPFSITLPPTFEYQHAGGKDKTTYPLPPTYSDKACLIYTVEVVLKRDFFHANDSLTKPIRYVQRTRPDPPSELRRVAYMDGTPIPGPDVDPLGWTITSFILSGRLFGAHDITVPCQIAIPSPTQFTRGTSVPFYLSVSQSPLSTTPSSMAQSQAEAQAVSLLANPRAWAFTLLRRATLTTASNDTARILKQKGKTTSEEGGGFNSGTNVILDIVAKGRSWPNTEGDDGWQLKGEIGAPRTLWPSFEFPSVVLEYAIRLTPTASGFIPHKHKTPTFLSKLASSKSPSSISDVNLNFADARGSYRIPITLTTSHARGMHLAGSFIADPDAYGVGRVDSPAPTYEDDFSIRY